MLKSQNVSIINTSLCLGKAYCQLIQSQPGVTAEWMKTQLLIELVQLLSNPCMVSCDNRVQDASLGLKWHNAEVNEIKFCCHWKKENCGYLLTQRKTCSALSSLCPTWRNSSHLKNKTSEKTRTLPFLCVADFASRQAYFCKFLPHDWGEPGNVAI